VKKKELLEVKKELEPPPIADIFSCSGSLQQLLPVEAEESPEAPLDERQPQAAIGDADLIAAGDVYHTAFIAENVANAAAADAAKHAAVGIPFQKELCGMAESVVGVERSPD
jgi:hypothetical protein